jgi:hypothetical protein
MYRDARDFSLSSLVSSYPSDSYDLHTLRDVDGVDISFFFSFPVISNSSVFYTGDLYLSNTSSYVSSPTFVSYYHNTMRVHDNPNTPVVDSFGPRVNSGVSF